MNEGGDFFNKGWFIGIITLLFGNIGIVLLLLFVSPAPDSIVLDVDRGIEESGYKDAVGIKSIEGDFAYQDIVMDVQQLTFITHITVTNQQSITVQDALVTAQVVHNDGVEIAQAFTDRNGVAEIVYFVPEQSVVRVEILDIDGPTIEYDKTLNGMSVYQHYPETE